MRPHPKRRRPGAMLVEVVVSAILVGVVMVAALDTVGSSLRTQRASIEVFQGELLAERLLAEVQALPYADEVNESAPCGRDSGEAVGDRDGWNDCDDYKGFTETPPTDLDGVAIAGGAGWTWEVDVRWVDSSFTANSIFDLGLKKIVVTVTSPTGATTMRCALKGKWGVQQQAPEEDGNVLTSISGSLQIGGGAAATHSVPLVNHAGVPGGG